MRLLFRIRRETSRQCKGDGPRVPLEPGGRLRSRSPSRRERTPLVDAAVLSESRVEALIRPPRKRRQLRDAGSTRGSNAASRWGTPNLRAPIRAAHKSGVDDLRVEGDRSIRKRIRLTSRDGQRETSHVNEQRNDAAAACRYQTGTSGSACTRAHDPGLAEKARDHGRSASLRGRSRTLDAGSHPGGRRFESG